MGLFGKKDNQTKDAKQTSDSSVSDKKSVASDSTKTATKDLYDSTKAPIKDEKKPGTRNAYRVLLKPLITEKAANLGEVNKYIFEVAVDANKIEVVKAVKEVYGVSPVSVNMVSVSGKQKRHGRIMGKRKDWKKAIVTLKKGETLNVYEGV